MLLKAVCREESLSRGFLSPPIKCWGTGGVCAPDQLFCKQQRWTLDMLLIVDYSPNASQKWIILTVIGRGREREPWLIIWMKWIIIFICMRDWIWKSTSISDGACTVALQRTIHKPPHLVSMKHPSFWLIVVGKRGMKVNDWAHFPLRILSV